MRWVGLLDVGFAQPDDYSSDDEHYCEACSEFSRRINLEVALALIIVMWEIFENSFNRWVNSTEIFRDRSQDLKNSIINEHKS
jgi:hypothetical protein